MTRLPDPNDSFPKQITNSNGLLLLIYALSGAAALLYQVVWQRWLVFTVGLSTVSIGIIVAGFLSGLGLGYLVGGRLADRLTPRQALLTFAALEVGIAVAALLSEPVLYGWLPTVGHLGPEAPGLTYITVLLLLLPPTFLMGASLPVLSRSIQLGSALEQSGFISRLYFANTLGGALAAVATAFVLAAQWGFDGAVWIGALLNLTCAAGGLYLGRGVWHQIWPSSGAATTAAASAPPSVHENEPPPAWWLGWLAHAFAAGLTGIAWEVLAFRLVENIVKSRAQTFAIILSVFLAGLAIGGLIGDRVRDGLATRRRSVFLTSQTMMYVWLAASVVGLIAVLEHASFAGPWLGFIASYEPSNSPSLLAVNYLLLPAVVLFGPALLMGFGFSLSQQLLQTSFVAVGRRLGLVQFVNILGCVAGATLTTQLAIPTMGTSGALKAVSLIGLGYAVVWWREAPRRWQPAVAALLLLGMTAAVPEQDHIWRVLAGQRDLGRLFYREDASGVSSIRVRQGRWPEADVFANGLGQSVLPRPLDPHHVLLGAIPTMVHPAPARVGIIGVGSGGTLWGASASPRTEQVVAWEIMASQPALLLEYADRTGDKSVSWFARDPRIVIRHADGRHALRASGDQYDIIEADALRPSSGYAGNLYSMEFFQLVRSKLRTGGLAATWVPTPRVLETMRRVFPHVVYLGNLVALGSDTPIDADWSAVAARLADPRVRAHFAEGHIDIEALMAPVFAQGVAPLPPLGPFDPVAVNTDMHPRDELPAPGAILLKLIGR
jgi:spermidine synthase